MSDEAWAGTRTNVWALAYSITGEPTRAEADEAFAALRDLGGELPEPGEFDGVVDTIGGLLLGAGRLDEAVRWLNVAASECRLTPPIRAQFLLARAHEEKGDVAEACAGYSAVLRGWGHAKPRSVTAEAARARVKKLGCAPLR